MLAYLNGEFLPADQVRVSPFDRGFLFADGVYEAVRSGPALAGKTGPRFVGMNRHVRRLTRSLGELRIDFDARELARVSAELVKRSGIEQALIYFQVTRGAPDLATQPARSHTPPAGMKPTVFAFVRPAAVVDFQNPTPLIKKCVTLPDLRWHRCDIKSISLLGNALASRGAADAGADEAVLLREAPGGEKTLSEGALTNVLVVTSKGELVTPPLETNTVLPGITREILLDLEPSIRQGAVSERELREAREVMLLGTTAAVTSVTQLDGKPVGGGTPGPVAQRLAVVLARAILEGREDIG
ncbi:MAG: aminotransferase class IV [Phycisphaerales bacterium]